MKRNFRIQSGRKGPFGRKSQKKWIDGYSYTSDQCQVKFKNLKQTYVKTVDHKKAVDKEETSREVSIANKDSKEKSEFTAQGNTNAKRGTQYPFPRENLPSTNVWYLLNIGFQMPWRRKWRES